MVCKGYLDLFQFLIFCMFIYLSIIIIRMISFKNVSY